MTLEDEDKDEANILFVDSTPHSAACQYHHIFFAQRNFFNAGLESIRQSRQAFSNNGNFLMLRGVFLSPLGQSERDWVKKNQA